jgi:hypothetical protein
MRCMILAIVTWCPSCIIPCFSQEIAQPPDCLTTNHRQLAFLLGEWDVTARKKTSDEDDSWTESKGTSSWKLSLGGCLYLEEWDGFIGKEPLEWIQILAYDSYNQRWQQGSIDTAHGNMITAEGSFEKGELIIFSP